jgi:hypothetical protein
MGAHTPRQRLRPHFRSFKIAHNFHLWSWYKSSPRVDFHALSRYSCKLLANRFLRVPPQSPFKRLLIGTKLYLSTRMSTSSKMPGGREKGHLGNHPPVSYIPPTDLLQTKDSTETLKVKLADGLFSMSVFAKGSPEDYLQHIIAVLRLIDPKGLHVQCKKHANEMKNAAAALGALQHKSIGLQDLSFKKDQEALMTEKTLTQELLATATKSYNEAVEATYKLLRNLLAGKPRTARS